MSGFRRAQLRGSDELFRPTRPGEAAAEAASRAATPPASAASSPGAVAAPPRLEGRLVRLSEEELNVLADALQRLKFPSSSRPAVTKPSVAEFERLEELRQKLLG
jgi:hypothetical protein